MWEVLRVKADTWAVVQWLTHWGSAPVPPRLIYARASRHRSLAAAQRVVDTLNRGVHGSHA
jgi:hypothetical protein